MSFSSLRSRRAALVEVEVADGTVGMGESWINYPPWAWVERVATIRDGIAPLLVGEELDDVGALAQSLQSALAGYARQWGAPGPVWQAISGTEIALWDLKARMRGVSVAELVGGRTRDEVPVYASGLDRSNVPDLAARCAREGYRGIKVRVGLDRRQDREAVDLAASVLDGGCLLYLDANQAWPLEEALERVGELRQYPVEWIEEPVRGGRPDELAELARRTGMAVAAGENVYGRRDFHELASTSGVRVLQPDVSKAGGLGEMIAVCDVASATGVSVSPHWYGAAVGLAATLQIAAVHPAIDQVELDVRDNPLRSSLTTEPFSVKDGAITIPDGPGLGIEIDEIRAASYEEQ